MSKQQLDHEYLEWARQKLEETDATLLELERQIETMKDDVRAPVERAAVEIKTARDAFAANVEALRADVSATIAAAEDVHHELDARWAEIEMSVQNAFNAIAGQADAMKAVVTARADAQRRAMQSSFLALKTSAGEAIDRARDEVDAVIHRITAETENVETKLGKVTAAGGDAWKAVRDALADTKAIHERTWKAIHEAVSRIR